ncbi:MAG: NADH-quinone oxidoreductase subunit NuoF [Anaerolineales bacterium]|nr:NADH-quinone oxidoreductase subunit NuoF [Anaerolineales bacterium]
MNNGKLNNPSELEQMRGHILSSRDLNQTQIIVCAGTGCSASGALDVKKALEEAIETAEIEIPVETKISGCRGFCEQGPLVSILPENILYTQVKPKDASKIVQKNLIDDDVAKYLLYRDPETRKRLVHEEDIPFYKEQQRLLLADSGEIDPTSFEDYLAVGGYKALSKALQEMHPEEIIQEIQKAGLRGRGGAGFPTGKKWELCRASEGAIKYVICNADEGDPGAFQDRSLMEANPHSVLEGLIIGAYAIGASKGYLYIRHEYPLAVERLEIAVESARNYGLIGKNILGTGFDFEIAIQYGAGAFVCGEETALMASIEGDVGEPRTRPPYPTEKGLWDKPTNINNVKTWASVPYIINKGADWYAQIGTENSKGTTIFSLVGKVKNTGLVEVPLGITLRSLIEDIGGGFPQGTALKAVQTGGPSGGCIPERLWDLPIDYESLQEVGSIMGSGGLIVMDERTCMVDLARYFMEFSRFESCGKCSSCREGSKRMLEVLDYITRGYGEEGDIELLEKYGEAVKEASLCGLGKTIPNPVLTTIRYFRDEYEAHIQEKRCPAGVCKDLVTYSIDPEKCTGCHLCYDPCPSDSISGKQKEPHKIDTKTCIKCGICYEVCNLDAVLVE